MRVPQTGAVMLASGLAFTCAAVDLQRLTGRFALPSKTAQGQLSFDKKLGKIVRGQSLSSGVGK